MDGSQMMSQTIFGRRTWMRALAIALLVAACVIGPLGRRATAQDDDAGADEARCHCVYRQACYHFLNAPVAPPDDPRSCEKCASGALCVAGREIPKGFNAACMASNRMACFLKRHAVSWKINCSACLANTKCCPFPGRASCPRCDGDHDDPFEKDAMRQDARLSMEKQLEIEKQWFDQKRVVVAYSRHFYVVTDIPKIKLMSESGKVRVATTHEYAHLMVQRAEQAYTEFGKVMHGRVKLLRPMGIYLPKSETDGRKLQASYFRNSRNHMIYSSYQGRGDSAISEGFCLNGFCVPLQRMKQSAAAARSLAGDDYALHGAMRHLMAHVMITCWIGRNGENRTMPRWAFVGIAHWFNKRLEKHRDVVYYCTGEQQKISGSSKDWRKKLKKRALSGDLAPIAKLLAASSLGHLNLEERRQCWGYFDVALESDDWREPWVDLLADLRKERDVREAFEEHLGMSPEAFHEAWVARLLGKDASEAADVETPSATKLDAMMDPAELEAGIRALGRITGPAEIAALLDLVGIVRSDRVRETGLDVLLKVVDAAARRAIWEYGLSAPRPLSRAYAARAVRLLQLTGAKDALRPLVKDAHWLVRAESALASAALRDFNAQSGIRALSQDTSPKTRIAAMDALAAFGEEVNSTCLPLVAKNLSHARWQVRIAAAQTLAEIGAPESIPPLLERAEKEGGRVREEIFATLRRLSGEDMGNDVEKWKGWWRLEERSANERGGFAVTGAKPKPEEPGRYAPDNTPTVYGERIFSQRIVFVIDTSRSTNRNFSPSPGTKERLLGSYGPGNPTISEMSRIELRHAIEQLDPRAVFNVVAFASDVATWKNALVPASAGNKRSGASFAKSRSPWGETNFHGALGAALEIGERTWTSPSLPDSADTVHLLTDGSPTIGDVVEPEQFLRWFIEVNRYARARIYVVVYGNLGVNETFLQRLAHQGGGTFTQLLEHNAK